MQARNKSLHLTVGCLVFATVLLALAVFNWLARQDATTSSAAALPALQGAAAVEHLKQQGLYASLSEAMTATQYGIKSVPENLRSEHANHFVANNPANNLRAGFAPERVELTPATQSDSAWHLGITLRSAGYGDQQLKIDAGSLTAQGSRIEYARPVADGQSTIKEWYVNTPSGLEQGFTLAEPPGTRQAGKPLRLALALDSELRARVDADGQAVEFVDAAGNNVLRYDHLAVSDARGRKLSALMRVNKQELFLEVEDVSAVYPVTVDPTFVQQAYLKASNTDSDDSFGTVTVSGDTVVVGALYEDSNATGVNGNQADNSAENSGAAYVFVRSGTTWSQQAYLKASNTGSDDWFGGSVALSGNTLVIGALAEDSNATGVNGNQADNSATGSGAAYVFVRSGTIWSQQAYLKASNTGSGDNFGSDVAVSGDTIVVGARFESSSATGVNGNQADNSAPDSGAAYVFVRNGTTWSQQAYLKASNTGSSDAFSTGVALSGDIVVVGAHGEDSNATGVNGNQTDNSASDSGAAYIFVRNGTMWSQQAYLKASNTGGSDEFGISVGVSGETVLVGAWNEDSNATGVNGNQSNNSAENSGAAYVFVRSGTVWSQQAYLKASNTEKSDRFGQSVAVSDNTLVVGAIYESSDSTGVDGNQANNSAPLSGAAYVFVRSGATWNQQAYLKPSNTMGGQIFGSSVAVAGDLVVIGAVQESSNATGVNGNQANLNAPSSGAVYVFSVSPIVVNSLADGAPANDGQCTLREALINANNNNQSGSTDCAAGSGADTITFSITGTINLTGALPDITDSLTIAGSGANQLTVRRDTGGDYRIFNIPNSGLSVSISGLTITNGKANGPGGGILSRSNLLLTDCAIVNNEASGFGSGGGVSLQSADGSFTGCTFNGNVAVIAGAGVHFLGDGGHTLTLTNCTVSGNTTTVGVSGGIFNGSFGGSSTLEVINSTIANNSASQAGGGIFTQTSGAGTTATTRLRNTIVANNSLPNLATDALNGGGPATVTSFGYNLSSDNGGGFLTGPSDQINKDPKLGPLGNNGGPTQTQALLLGSPAIDAGTATGAPTTDQRGVSRPKGGGVDIGAFESLPPMVVNSLADGAPANDGQCTLREALINANNNNQSGSTDCAAGSGADTVSFSVTGTINLTGALPDITDSLTIVGPGANLLTVRRDTGGDYRIFTIGSGNTVGIAGLTITRGSLPASEGGGILNAGSLTLTDCAVTGNYANGGGGIMNNGSLTMTGCTISRNTSNFDGGGLYNLGNATANLTNCTFSGNVGTSSGIATGGGSGETATTLLTNCTLSAHSIGDTVIKNINFGGGLNVKTQLRNTLVAGNDVVNFAIGAGTTLTSLGGNFDSDGSSGFTDGIVGTAQFKLDASLGPLANNGGSTQTHALAPYSPAINGGIATGAPAADQRGFSRPYGGGVDIGAFELHALYVNAALGNDTNNGTSFLSPFKTVAKGIGTASDGDVVFVGTGTYPENNLVINKNVTIQGAGAGRTVIDGQQLNRVFTIPSGQTVTFTDLTIANGSVPTDVGGGVLNSGTLTVTNCAITGNSGLGGAGIENRGSLTMTGSTVSGNTAVLDGSGVRNEGNANASLTNCTISGNTNTGVFQSTVYNVATAGTALLVMTNCTVTANTAISIIKSQNTSSGVITTQLRNTLVAGNSGENFSNINTTHPSLTNSLDSDGTSGATNGVGGNLVGTAANKLNAKLGPLANNGGPTQTHALLRGSPAIDAGSNFQAPATDQRGLPREKDGNGDGLVAVDIGAYELSYRFVNVATGNDNNSGLTPTSPHKTLARAITVAGDGEILILAAGTYPENNLTITKTLSFEGAGAGQTIIDGQQLKRVFSITQSGLNIGFSNLTIKGGKAPASGDDYDGGGIMSASDLTLADCALVNNEARQVGGAVYLYLANGTFTGCTFNGNKAGLGGGAIVLLANTGNVLQLINSTVSGNTALGQGAGGGVLNVPGGTLEVINSTIANNTGAAAAGIYTATSASITTATTRLRNSILANADANLQKGVIGNDDVFTAGGPATITSLGNNLASDGGGGFLIASGDLINKDPKLSPLANNGGQTQTHLLLCGSPAINAGSNTGAPTTDQRGVARPQGGTVDIGAVEGDYSLSIAQTPLPKGKVGVAYSAGIYIAPTTTPLPLIFTATTPLPAGLRLDLDQLGYPIITGTPTAAVSNFGFTLMAVSLLEPGKQGCFNYTITIDPACPTITINPETLPAGQLGQQYNQQLTQTGGAGAIAWSFTGNLPGNVTLNPTTGLISGAPTTSGTFNFSVTATDANGCASAPKAYSLVIAQCPSITINPATLPGGQIGLQYSQQLTQTGGTGTLMWSFAGGLPTGVTMNLTTGLISGKPTVSGTFDFSVAVKDANGCMSSTPKSYSLVIAPCPTIAITPASLSPGTVNIQFTQLLTASGGTAPYTFSVNAGSTLPPGLSLSGNSLTGSPTTANSFSFTIKVTDAAGCTGTQSYTLLVNPAITSNGLQFYPLAQPMRLLDTRPANERPGPAFDLPGARLVGEINGGTPRTQNARVSFDGLTVPANAKAIVGTATVVNYPGAGQYTGTGNVTFYPSNRPKPEVSNLNYAANQTISNGFTVALGDDGAFRIFCYSDVHLVIDVVGYYAPPGAGGLYFHPLPRPLRALETRPQTFFPGCETPRVKLQAGSTRTLQGQFSCEGITIPNSAKALVGNLTSVNAESNGEATVYAGDIAPLPLANTLSYVSTQAIPNAFVTRLSNTGNYNLFVSQTTDMLVDLTGYFSAEASDLNGQGLLLTLLETPIRKLETRPELFYPGCITPRAPLAGNSETVIPALGTCDGVTIPATARALIGNATVVNFLSQGSGNVTMYPTAANRPEASNLNYVANQVIPNAFTVGLSADGKFTVYVFSTIHLLIDVTGYYAP